MTPRRWRTCAALIANTDPLTTWRSVLEGQLAARQPRPNRRASAGAAFRRRSNPRWARLVRPAQRIPRFQTLGTRRRQPPLTDSLRTPPPQPASSLDRCASLLLFLLSPRSERPCSPSRAGSTHRSRTVQGTRQPSGRGARSTGMDRETKPRSGQAASSRWLGKPCPSRK